MTHKYSAAYLITMALVALLASQGVYTGHSMIVAGVITIVAGIMFAETLIVVIARIRPNAAPAPAPAPALAPDTQPAPTKPETFAALFQPLRPLLIAVALLLTLAAYASYNGPSMPTAAPTGITERIATPMHVSHVTAPLHAHTTP